MLSYDLWAEFRTLQNFAKKLAAKFRQNEFCRNEFRNTKIRVSFMLASYPRILSVEKKIYRWLSHTQLKQHKYQFVKRIAEIINN